MCFCVRVVVWAHVNVMLSARLSGGKRVLEHEAKGERQSHALTSPLLSLVLLWHWCETGRVKSSDSTTSVSSNSLLLESHRTAVVLLCPRSQRYGRAKRNAVLAHTCMCMLQSFSSPAPLCLPTPTAKTLAPASHTWVLNPPPFSLTPSPPSPTNPSRQPISPCLPVESAPCPRRWTGDAAADEA